MKVKVLFLVSTLESGGPTNVIFNIVKYLDRDIVSPVILTLSPEPKKSRKDEFLKLQVPIFQLNQNRISWILSGGSKKLKNLIYEIGPVIIHGHSLRPDVFLAKERVRWLMMSTLHSDLYANYVNTYGRLIGWHFARTHLSAAKKLDRVVACSNSVYDLYKNEIKQIISIPNGIDSAIFYPLQLEAVIKKRNELGLPGEKKIFISAGALTKRKNPAIVIEGFLNSNCANDAVLLILGNGELLVELKEKYNALKNIIFMDFITDVDTYMKVADFFISASSSEGLPNTVMEALGCGLPVILSDIPSHMEILSKNKKAGYSFDCSNHFQLAQVINKIVKDDYHSLRQASIEIITNNLNANIMSSQYQKLYLNLSEKSKEPIHKL